MDSRIIETKLAIIAEKRTIESVRIENAMVRTAGYKSPGEYTFEGGWVPLGEGDRWPAGVTVFIGFEVAVPSARDHLRPVLHVDWVGLEGLLSMDGKPFAGVDENHRDIPLEWSTTYRAEIEAAAWLRALHDPVYRNESARLRTLELGLVDTRIEQAWYDLSFAYEASAAVADRRRRALLLEAVEEAMLEIDVTREGAEFVGQVTRGREILNGRIAEIGCDPRALVIALTAHAHIDVAWLWPLRETVRKSSRTFSTVLRLMERYPDFRFSCSQPVLYEYVRDHYPSLYKQIKPWVSVGRWETTGGMWVEADCNISSGESLIRQSLYGLRFFREEFGTRPRVCWLPDVFGFPASLPQILTACGYEGFFTVKLYWQARNRFPHSLFRWQGIDGSRILAHIPRLSHMYNSRLEPAELRAAEEELDQLPSCNTVLMPFGYGDGGGGPTEKMLEYAERSAGFPGLPTCRHTGADRFFEEILSEASALPEWTGELYLETHRGTLTSQAKTKKGNRRNEIALRNAEILGWMAAMTGAAVDMTDLEAAWKKLLTLQFHDILPGSSIGMVHAETEEEHRAIAETAGGVIRRAAAEIARRVSSADIVVFNTLSWTRNDPVTARLPRTEDVVGLSDPGGRGFAAQRVGMEGETGEYVFVPHEIPALGYTSLRVERAEPDLASPLIGTERSLENELCRIEVNERGELVRYYDKIEKRELIDPAEPANRLQFFQDGPERESAWNLHATFSRREYPAEGPCLITLAERGPVRISLRIEREFRDSRIVQEIRLYRGLRRIDFHTRVDWRERQVLLKAAFPVSIRSDHASYEVQFGAVRRPTHRNTSWEQEKFEVAAHRWVDLSEPGYGVSLLNDCKYGHDVVSNVIRISLLRGTERPDPEADLGEHEFTYSLYPHAGDWTGAETVRRAAELNVPAMAVPSDPEGDAGTPLPSEMCFATVEGTAILETVKPAEDGRGWILRTYEPHGGRGESAILPSRPMDRIEEVNAVEERMADIAPAESGLVFDLKPFQIRTFRCNFGGTK